MTLPFPCQIDMDGQTYGLTVAEGGRIDSCHVDLGLWCGRKVSELAYYLRRSDGTIRGLNYRGQCQLQYVIRTGELHDGGAVLNVAMGQARGLSEVHLDKSTPYVTVPWPEGVPPNRVTISAWSEANHAGSSSPEELAALRFLLRALNATVAPCPPPRPSKSPRGSGTGSRSNRSPRRA